MWCQLRSRPYRLEWRNVLDASPQIRKYGHPSLSVSPAATASKHLGGLSACGVPIPAIVVACGCNFASQSGVGLLWKMECGRQRSAEIIDCEIQAKWPPPVVRKAATSNCIFFPLTCFTRVSNFPETYLVSLNSQGP